MFKHLLVAVALLAAFVASPAKADWCASFEELRFGIGDGKMLTPVLAARSEYDDMVRMIEENQRTRRGL